MTSSAEEQAHPGLSNAQQQGHREGVAQPTVRLVRPENIDADTDQTSGMQRLAAISSTLVGSQGIWAGYTVINQQATTGLHHHGEEETVIYVKSGQAKVRWGAQLQQEVLAQAGSFVYIPAFLPHQEINPSADSVSEWVVVRNGPEAIVVNLE
jgi:uncharacterized RmlC-like cupin family protein